MKFLNRTLELERLDGFLSSGGALAVVYGRRRIGKTRMLVTWCRRHGGLYTVADLSAPRQQRQYLADAIGQRIAGFGDLEFRDWRGLFARLSREAQTVGWRGPLVIDEFPYLVMASPELPSVLQHWVESEAREDGVRTVLAGSSQRMMQGLILGRDAPLYGRSTEILEVRPLDASFLAQVFPVRSVTDLIELHTAWGGVPRYWELAAGERGPLFERIERLVLDPLGPLHREPEYLLLEEVPSALEVRPVLDAIGAGAHRLSEMASRIGRPATSLSRPLARLVELRLVRRETPFGEPERQSKRSIYCIDDPFFRLWFRIVAPYHAQLEAGSSRSRLSLLARHWDGLVAAAWEELCRSRLSRTGPWGPASRWWKGAEAEWDVVAESLDGRALLLGEVKWSTRPLDDRALDRELDRLAARPEPQLPTRFAKHRRVRALMVPGTTHRRDTARNRVLVVTADQLLGEPRRPPRPRS